MKKLIVTLLVLTACHSAPPSTSPERALSGSQTGAPDPASAIRGFLSAAKQQDLQAMGAIWGTPQGAARDQMDRAYMEKAEFVMICYLKHDRYDIIGDAPNPGGARAFAVNMTLGDMTRATTFDVVEGPAKRWYVQNVDVAKLGEFCAKRG